MAFLLAATLPPALLPTAGAAPPFGIGDWVVTGTEALIDGGVILDGNLTVEAGGSLTLVNSTLQLLPGPHEVRVRYGGELRILAGSSVGSFDGTDKDEYRAGFWVETGARAEFRNSSFTSIGIIYRWEGSTKIGGVCIYADNAVVDNCTFSGNYIGLTLFGSTLVTNCRFRENSWAGALSYGADTVWAGCAFSHDFYGAIAYRGSAAFQDTDFADNAIGAAADSTYASFSGCDFLRNVRTGLYVSPEQGTEPLPYAAYVHVDRCLFEANRWGINGVFFYSDEGGNIWPLEHELFLSDCDFLNNTQAGVLWDRFIPDGRARQAASTWNVTGRSEAFQNAIHFKGNVQVGGVLEVRSSTLRIDCEGAGWQRVEVRPGGRLDIAANSNFTSANSNPFGFHCAPGSSFRLDGSLLKGCGWDVSDPARAGPFIETGNVSITRSSILFCPIALTLYGAVGARLEDSALNGNVSAMLLRGSTARVQNCTLDAPGANLCRLDNASLLESVNSTIHPEKLDFGDGLSRVELSWYLDVRAVWTDGRPIGGASLVITDFFGTEVHNTTLDGQGHAADLAVKQASVTMGGSELFTPHRLVCRQGPVGNVSDLEVAASSAIRIVLSDSDPPSLSVTGPGPDEHLRTRQVRLSGRAQDNLALETVLLAVDGFRRFLVHQDPRGEQWQVDWNFTVELPEGYHTFEAVAVDTGGLRAVRSFPFWVDVSAPNVLITYPYNGFLTNDPGLDVGGVAEPGAAVSVNGVEARTQGNAFSARMSLSEGENLVTATAVDAAGNSNQSSIIVRLDTLPPALDVEFTPDAGSVREPQVGIRGTMERGAALTVNGRRVVLPGIADNFTTLVWLVPGNNTIAVEAADAAGNVNSVVRRMALDTVPPAFRVVYPPDGLLTKERSLGIVLEIEAGTVLSAGNATYDVPGRAGQTVNFSVTYALQEGPNDLLLSCRDAAGNVFGQRRAVTLDTLPPALELQTPAEGNRTQSDSVYVIGRTEPGADVTVNGERLEAGQGGSFSGELRLGAGRNRIVVRAADAVGNVVEITVNVTRVPAPGGTTVVGISGPDWLFVGFLAACAGSAAGEGFWLWRRQSRRPLNPGPTLPPGLPVRKGVP